MGQVFADTDILLDLLSRREPHYPSAAALFSMADRGNIVIYVSSLSFANLNYLLSRQYSAGQARNLLMTFKTLVKVLPITDKIVELALASEFKDFEDAMQYFTALEHGINILLTRNLKDYKHADIQVLTAEHFLRNR